MKCFDGWRHSISFRYVSVSLFILIMLKCIFAFQDGVTCTTRDNSNPVIVWWTPFIENAGLIKKKCAEATCLITDDRFYVDGNCADAVLFYGSNIDVTDIPKKNSSFWALLHEESPKNKPMLCHPPAISLFNFTSTYRQFSNEPLTLQYLKSLPALIDSDTFLSITLKNNLIKNNHIKNNHIKQSLAPVIFLQSDCDTPSNRDHFVKELSKHIKIDSYGLCLNNKSLPAHLRGGVETMNHPDLLALTAEYKFALALENSAHEDYITEKFWRPLTLGVVPIYWGAPNIGDWAPNGKMSYIDVRAFENTMQLAQYLHQLNENDSEYEKYISHKLRGQINNKKLVNAMNERKWGIDNDPEKINFIENFECEVCNAVHRHKKEEINFVADTSHYGCKEPETVLRSMKGSKGPKFDSTSHWTEEWVRSRHEASFLRLQLDSGTHTPGSYYDQLLQYLIEVGHFKDYPPDVHDEL